MSDLISKRNVQMRLCALRDKQRDPNVMIGVNLALMQLEGMGTVEAEPVVRCKDCKHRGSPYSCPMRKLVMPFSGPGAFEDCTTDESFCSFGERKEAE